MTPDTAYAGRGPSGSAGEQATFAIRRQPTDPARPIDWVAFGDDPDAGHRERGYAAGHAEGRAAAEEELRRAERQRDAEVEQAVRAANRAVDAATRVLEERVDTLVRAVPGLVFDVVEALVGRELAIAADPGRDALARVLALSPSKEPVVARLHPEDVARLGDLGEIGDGREITVVADPSVAPGDAAVEIGSSRIESRLEEALARVRSVLVGGDPGVIRS